MDAANKDQKHIATVFFCRTTLGSQGLRFSPFLRKYILDSVPMCVGTAKVIKDAL